MKLIPSATMLEVRPPVAQPPVTQIILYEKVRKGLVTYYSM
jgi:hypothetical protein